MNLADALNLFAYALIFCGAVAFIATIAYVWNNYWERRFLSDLDKLGRVDNAERFLREVPFNHEATR